jgi:hypothetical protein
VALRGRNGVGNEECPITGEDEIGLRVVGADNELALGKFFPWEVRRRRQHNVPDWRRTSHNDRNNLHAIRKKKPKRVLADLSRKEPFRGLDVDFCERDRGHRVTINGLSNCKGFQRRWIMAEGHRVERFTETKVPVNYPLKLLLRDRRK